MVFPLEFPENGELNEATHIKQRMCLFSGKQMFRKPYFFFLLPVPHSLLFLFIIQNLIYIHQEHTTRALLSDVYGEVAAIRNIIEKGSQKKTVFTC